MFLGLFIRHIPVEKDGDDIGLFCIGDVLRAGPVRSLKIFKIKN